MDARALYAAAIGPVVPTSVQSAGGVTIKIDLGDYISRMMKLENGNLTGTTDKESEPTHYYSPGFKPSPS